MKTQDFNKAYIGLVCKVQEDGVPKLGIADKLLLKSCLSQVLENNLEESISDAHLSEAFRVYSENYQTI